MGVYINMEMPKDKAVAVVIHPDGTAYTAEMSAGVCTKYLADCKAAPVPPHGRLGDLDKLENGLRNMAKYQHGERQQGILGCCETIRLAPTVIEAEEET